jgi:hypothetical protein
MSAKIAPGVANGPNTIRTITHIIATPKMNQPAFTTGTTPKTSR